MTSRNNMITENRKLAANYPAETEQEENIQVMVD